MPQCDYRCPSIYYWDNHLGEEQIATTWHACELPVEWMLQRVNMATSSPMIYACALHVDQLFHDSLEQSIQHI